MSGKLQRLEEAERQFLLQMQQKAEAKTAAVLSTSIEPLTDSGQTEECSVRKVKKKKKKKAKDADEMIDNCGNLLDCDVGPPCEKRKRISPSEDVILTESTTETCVVIDNCDIQGCEKKKKSKKRKKAKEELEEEV
jgi:hypothetical protein